MALAKKQKNVMGWVVLGAASSILGCLSTGAIMGSLSVVATAPMLPPAVAVPTVLLSGLVAAVSLEKGKAALVYNQNLRQLALRSSYKNIKKQSAVGLCVKFWKKESNATNKVPFKLSQIITTPPLRLWIKTIYEQP